jgi:hypothetical protein
MFRRLVVIAIVLLPLLAGLSAPVHAQDATPGVEVDGVTVLAPDEPYAGLSRGEWDARWWQWTFSFPLELSPSVDPTGERCGYGQFGPVFFLPGNYGAPGTVTCVVPEGTAIFVPVFGAGCSSVEPPPYFGRNEEELRACAASFADDAFTDLQARINGEEVPDLEDYRSSSPVFPLPFPANHVFFEVPKEISGVALAVAEGYSFIVAPPPPGEYEIVTSTGVYRVIVEAPQIIEPEATPGATPAT